MSYLQSAKGFNISRQRALKELRDHGLTDFKSFFEELGNKKTYDAERVLLWLGY